MSSRTRLRAVLRWCTRCSVGLSLIALIALTATAFAHDARYSPHRKHAAGDDGPRTAGYRHAPGTSHDHGDGYTVQPTVYYARRIFASYSLFVHVMALGFPIRSCWSIWDTTKLLKKAQPVWRSRLATCRKQLLELPRALSLQAASSSGSASEVSESEYDADTELLPGTVVIHAILVPNYREDKDNLRETLEVLASHPQAPLCYDVYLAMEERETGSAEKASELATEFMSAFRNVIYTVHPGNIPGEAPGKSSNIAWAADQARRRYLTGPERRLRENVIITIMDSDSHLSADYFSQITDMHLTYVDSASTTMYVPPIVFDRNANSVSLLVRVADLLWCGAGLSGLYQGSAIRPPTSCYSVPLTLVELVGGWDTGPDAIGEDLHMYIKCFFALGGNLNTRTVYSAASQSNIHSDLKGIHGKVMEHRARFKQATRHMWGSLDTGYALRQLFKLCLHRARGNDGGLAAEGRATANRVRIGRSQSPPLRPVNCDIDSKPRSAVNWTNMCLLFLRLFEAHFLPLHLVTLMLASSLYPLIKRDDQLSPDLLYLFQVTGLLRFLGFCTMMGFFCLYEPFHKTCVSRREREMQQAGLADRMHGSFVYRNLRENCFDYIMFPVAGVIFGSVPAAYAQLAHFWTVDLTYSVSKKPQRIAAALKAYELV